MVEISASILNAEKEKIVKTIYNLETAGVDYFHIDVMDGKFVSNNTTELMHEYCGYLKNITNVPLDVHLMVEDAKEYIDMFLPYSPNIITIHYEAVKNMNELIDYIDYIHANNCKAGIAIKPNTEVSEIFELLKYANVVLVMTVEPGEGGQKLINDTINNVVELKKYIEENNIDTIIEADGGITEENAQYLKDAGAEVLVVGTALLKSTDYKGTVANIKK